MWFMEFLGSCVCAGGWVHTKQEQQRHQSVGVVQRMAVARRAQAWRALLTRRCTPTPMRSLMWLSTRMSPSVDLAKAERGVAADLVQGVVGVAVVVGVMLSVFLRTNQRRSCVGRRGSRLKRSVPPRRPPPLSLVAVLRLGVLAALVS